MNINVIINLMYIIYIVIVTILFIIISTRSNLLNRLPKLISSAEEEKELNGKEKMCMVVSYAKSLVPRIFKVLFDDKVIEQMAQNIYDDMKSYRENYIMRKVEDKNKQKLVEIEKIRKE